MFRPTNSNPPLGPMGNVPEPEVGAWYARRDGALFEIVALDRDDGTIEIQHFDGTLEECDFETWNEQAFLTAEAPEDWTGSVDVEPEDYDSQDDAPATDAGSALWAGPLDYLDRNEASGYSEWPRLPD